MAGSWCSADLLLRLLSRALGGGSPRPGRSPSRCTLALCNRVTVCLPAPRVLRGHLLRRVAATGAEQQQHGPRSAAEGWELAGERCETPAGAVRGRGGPCGHHGGAATANASPPAQPQDQQLLKTVSDVVLQSAQLQVRARGQPRACAPGWPDRAPSRPARAQLPAPHPLLAEPQGGQAGGGGCGARQQRRLVLHGGGRPRRAQPAPHGLCGRRHQRGRPAAAAAPDIAGRHPGHGAGPRKGPAPPALGAAEHLPGCVQ